MPTQIAPLSRRIFAKIANPRALWRSYLFRRKRRADPIAAARWLRSYDGYEKQLSALVSRECETLVDMSRAAQNPVLIDCGASDGNVLTRFADNLPNFRLIAFEVQAELLPYIEKAVPRAEVHPCAVGVSDDQVEIALPKTSGINYRGGTSTVPDRLPSERIAETRIVEQVRFVDFLRSLRAEGHDFVAVKMDIEGGEYAILDDYFANSEGAHIDVLMIEFHPECLPQGRTAEHYAEHLDKAVRHVSTWI